MKTHVSSLKPLISDLQDFVRRGMMEPKQAKALVDAIRRCDHALTVGDRRNARKRLDEITRRVWELISAAQSE